MVKYYALPTRPIILVLTFRHSEHLKFGHFVNWHTSHHTQCIAVYLEINGNHHDVIMRKKIKYNDVTWGKTRSLRVEPLDAPTVQEVFHCDTIESPAMDDQLLYSLMLMAHHVQLLHLTDALQYADAVVLQRTKENGYNIIFQCFRKNESKQRVITFIGRMMLLLLTRHYKIKA